ncbi:sulfite exporter TauE/SafE family protein [Riemerella columbipharyngis]|uniref:Probable membrane transporter protein n=1 Tax=Riemerella columbipharyngis TaxID=1071918 RepID=A0A1G7CGR3_9FLAO|nr:sulfite exporter TauE/SafE family protein [Riemerella columbipharyngis]SDE38443.1 hypothetical protein SAMN05421544_10837 [Riemerella columbipharyngis]
MLEFWILFVGAISAGLLGSLTGLGGGVVIIPILTLGFHIPVPYAVGASLISVIGTSSGSASAFVKEGYTNMRIGIFLEIATTFGAILGALAAGILDSNTIGIIFGLILMLTAVLGIRKKPDHQLDIIEDSWARKLKLYGSFPKNGKIAQYSSTNIFEGFAMMGFAGMMSGLLGIGGGVLKVLAMDNIMKLPFKVSTTTSNFMIGVTAAASAFIYFQRGEIIPEIAAPVLIGVVAGSFIGSKIFMKIKTHSLKVIFSLVAAALSVYMIYKGLTGKFH